MDKKINYCDRQSRMKMVAQNYRPILNGRILDVGVDEGYIKDHLSPNCNYTGVGLGGKNEEIINIDLEKQKLPFNDGEFDIVLCLDVLEHLENIHQVFDELCRVSNSYVLISMPNPWKCMLSSIWRPYSQNRYMKFYGLPVEPPTDRHRWFFSTSECLHFIESKSKMNGFAVIESHSHLLKITQSNPLNTIFLFFIKILLFVFGTKIKAEDLIASDFWYVLKRIN